MGDFGASRFNLYGNPVEGINFIVDYPREEFHIKDKRSGDKGSPFLIPLEEVKLSEFPLLIKMDMKEVEMQDMISLERPKGKLKKCIACLMMDHSNLSKALSRSIFKIM